jgi:hypothetical protein
MPSGSHVGYDGVLSAPPLAGRTVNVKALFKPIDYAAEMFDRPALARDVSRMYRDAVGLLGA